MTIEDVFNGAQYLSDTVQRVEAHKLSIHVGDDFEEYAQIIRAGRPDQPLGPPFDPERQFLPKARGIWVTARNPQGDLIHTQAMRLLDLCDQTLARYLSARFGEFPPGGKTIDMTQSWYHAGPGARKITGRAVYHGEMWLADDSVYRGQGLIDVLSRFAFLTAMLHWQPDFLFGFILKPVARRGLADREGYMHSDPHCLRWQVAGQNAPLDCNMVWMGGDDLRHIMHVPLERHIPLASKIPEGA